MDAESDAVVATQVAVPAPIPMTTVVAMPATIEVSAVVPGSVMRPVTTMVSLTASVMPMATTVLAVPAMMGGRTRLGRLGRHRHCQAHNEARRSHPLQSLLECPFHRASPFSTETRIQPDPTVL